jgi:hypothetical protein
MVDCGSFLFSLPHIRNQNSHQQQTTNNKQQTTNNKQHKHSKHRVVVEVVELKGSVRRRIEEKKGDEEQLTTAPIAKRRHLNIISVLEQKEKFPLRNINRNKIDGLIQKFLEELGEDVHEIMCNNDAVNYRGLDSDRENGS